MRLRRPEVTHKLCLDAKVIESAVHEGAEDALKGYGYKVLNRTCACCCGFPPLRQNKLLKHRAKAYFGSYIAFRILVHSQLWPIPLGLCRKAKLHGAKSVW